MQLKSFVGFAAAAALAAGMPLAAAGGAAAQGRGMGRGMMHDADHMEDMRVFHELFDHRAEIVRSVTMRPDGVETLTESDVPAVAATLQGHVEAMLARVKEARPIHQRDPLFREIFANASKIEASYVLTPKGVRVVETSRDPYVAKLIQAHAEVVTAFVKNGRVEMMKNHPVPDRPTERR